ncbi:MAG TPA: 4Fe-4S dicluster domain-containing protein [Candidatus Binatia bacterium]|nr:4Fe-4S dicluster domain-containing protein [Candidatus Binatia bacterium]
MSDEQLEGWLVSLLDGTRRVVAPVAEDGLTLFREVTSADEIRLATRHPRTRLPAKETLLPATEVLFSYRLEAGGVALEVPPQPSDQVVIGLRPCDAAGTARLDEVLLADSHYADRRRRTALVTVACTSAGPACFCTAVGGSPGGTEAADLQVVPLQGSWLVRPLTDQGTTLVAGSAEGWPEASDEDWMAAEGQRRAVEATITTEPIPSEWVRGLAERFDAPAWQALAERCLGCGLCAYVCPSCACFDISDAGGALCGSRCRTWDSCGFRQFTVHAGGYNPRPSHLARHRQRVLHKFAWFPLEHGALMCVGCGRCVELCPAGIDIRQSVVRVMSG